jgi:hypothetical protein
MAFTDFKSPVEVQQLYQIKYSEADFLHIAPIAPPKSFIQELEFSKTYFDIFSSEASRCENVIYPLLREVCKRFVPDYSLWSHKSISVDNTLSGTPDYIIAKRSELGKNVLGRPLVLIAEAKQNDFTKGWGQCLAELVAAQKLNDNKDQVIYGIVTDGEMWQFGKIEGKEFIKNAMRITIDDIEALFGALCTIMESVSSGAPVT